MPVGFGVSLVVRGQTVDPEGMLTSLARASTANGIEIDRIGDVVRFTADELGDLSVLAAPLAGWWQQHGPNVAGDVALRFVGPGGVTELNYSMPELAVEHVQRHITFDSGRPYGPGEAPGPIRRLAAALLRRTRNGFTASELVIRDEGSVLCVALAGRDLDDQPRSLELQAFDPAHDDYDPGDDDGYCLVTEHHVPVVQGLVALQLTRRVLRLRLTDGAARTWGTRSAMYQVRLHLDNHEIEQLRLQLRRLFSLGSDRLPVPKLELE
ncbi:hypothetical protein ACFY2Q_17415 [Micromonospora sp. NPDC000316]|uniref:hypothetical protein n=1 Tax=Micromonospora sp. NPDC000316 TaxID=3364216 RepID=UPI003675E15F